MKNIKAVGFIGLTIEFAEATEIFNMEYFGPVKAGDIPTVVAEFSPQIIVIIDGLFHRVSSVLHKDILFALSKGVKVFGAASIGALRAAELYEYGMQGVGKIYHDYLSGCITGDDEVAVKTYFIPASNTRHADRWIIDDESDALVNIRATLENAVSHGLIEEKSKQQILSYAKKLCFIDRQWSTLLDPKIYGYLDDPYLLLRNKLVDIRVNQKKDDAILCLREAKAFCDSAVDYTIYVNNLLERDDLVPEGPFWDNTLWSRPLTLTGNHRKIDSVPLVQDLLDYAILSSRGHYVAIDSIVRILLLEIGSIVGIKPEKDRVVSCVEKMKKINNSMFSPLTKEELYKLAEDELVCEELWDQFKNKIQYGVLLTILSEGSYSVTKEKLFKAYEKEKNIKVRKDDDEIRSDYKAYLKASGVENIDDYFENYLSSIPLHRLDRIVRYVLSE